MDLNNTIVSLQMLREMPATGREYREHLNFSMKLLIDLEQEESTTVEQLNIIAQELDIIESCIALSYDELDQSVLINLSLFQNTPVVFEPEKIKLNFEKYGVL